MLLYLQQQFMNHRLELLIGKYILREIEHELILNFRHHTWVGHPREAVKIDNEHIAVYSEKNVIASLNTHSGAVGKYISHHFIFHHLKRFK